ncbi:MAG: hypothetical protein ABUK01_19235 [Leptospirales bacterium]
MTYHYIIGTGDETFVQCYEISYKKPDEIEMHGYNLDDKENKIMGTTYHIENSLIIMKIDYIPNCTQNIKLCKQYYKYEYKNGKLIKETKDIINPSGKFTYTKVFHYEKGRITKIETFRGDLKEKINVLI